jgi:hypothetical protein
MQTSKKGGDTMTDQWEMCTVRMPKGGLVSFFSGKSGWVSLMKQEYIAQNFPIWLQKNPKSDHVEDLIVLLLNSGWEPYAVVGDSIGNVQAYSFRRRITN